MKLLLLCLAFACVDGWSRFVRFGTTFPNMISLRGSGKAHRVQVSEYDGTVARSLVLARRPGMFLGASFPGSDLAARPYIGPAVEAAKARVDKMLRLHQGETDPLVLRMSHMADRCDFNFSISIRRGTGGGATGGGRYGMSVVCDMKRRSPSVPSRTSVVDYQNAEFMASSLLSAGSDALLVSTEPLYYSGSGDDLLGAVRACRSFQSHRCSPEGAAAKAPLPPSCIQKDIIIHPIQIAHAMELGSSGVLVMAGVVGADLPALLDAATLMGAEALVEVHSPNELDFALSCGASLFLVNTRDRFSGTRYPNQIRALSSLLPMNCIALACGGYGTDLAEIKELGYFGFDGVVLGRSICEVPDLSSLVSSIHNLGGVHKEASIGMKLWRGDDEQKEE